VKQAAYGILLPLLSVAWLCLPATNPAGAEPQKLVRGEAEDEEAMIQRRQEWFFASRRIGADGKMAERRREALDLLDTQRPTTSAIEASAGGWKAVGPFSSAFGGWRFGNVSGRIAALAKDPKTGVLYAGSASGGLWKTTDEGVSWTPLFDNAGTQTIGALAIDPQDPATIWAGTGENVSWCEQYFGIGLLRSTDGGRSWQKRNGKGADSLADLASFASIIIDPRDTTHLVVGGYWKNCPKGYFAGGVYVTRDAGASWKRTLTSAPVTRIVKDPRNHNLLWAGAADRGLYRSTDCGETWALQTGLPRGAVGRVDVAVSPSKGKVVYVLFESGGGTPQFWRTADGGVSWSRMASGSSACDGQCSYNMVLAVDPTDPQIVFRGTIQLFRTTNGGTSWANLTGQWGATQKVHQDTHALVVLPTNPRTIYVGCDGGVWKSTDGGRRFTDLNSNISATQFYDIGIHPADDRIIVGGSQDNSSLARTDGNTWDLQEVTGDGFVSIINPSDPNTVYTSSYPWDYGSGYLPVILRSTTGLFGSYWWITVAGCGIAAGDRIGWVTPYALDPSDPRALFLGTHRVYRSGDGGTSWSPVGPADMTAGGTYDNINTVNVSSTSGSYVYAGTTDARVWRTSDGGNTWGEISTGLPADRWINDIAPDLSNPAKAFCVVSGFNTAHLYEWNDSGSWIARGSGLPNVPANTVVMTGPDTIYVGTDIGVYASSDGGATFTPFASGMPKGLVVTDLEYNSHTKTMTAGTYGRGAWQIGLLAE